MSLDSTLKEIQYLIEDISLIKVDIDTDPKLLYVILCNTKEDSESVKKIVYTEPFNFTVWYSENGNCNFELKFQDSVGSVLIPTNYNMDNYPPLKYMNEVDQSSHFITIGMKQPNGHFQYSLDYLPLDNK